MWGRFSLNRSCSNDLTTLAPMIRDYAPIDLNMQKVKDRLKDVEITQESDKTFWFKGSVSNILSTSYILLSSPEFKQQVCQWKYIDANFPEYEIACYAKYKKSGTL